MKLRDLFAAKLIIFVNKDLLFMLPYSAPSMIKFSGKHPQLDSSCSNAHCPLIISIIYRIYYLCTMYIDDSIFKHYSRVQMFDVRCLLTSRSGSRSPGRRCCSPRLPAG